MALDCPPVPQIVSDPGGLSVFRGGIFEPFVLHIIEERLSRIKWPKTFSHFKKYRTIYGFFPFKTGYYDQEAVLVLGNQAVFSPPASEISRYPSFSDSSGQSVAYQPPQHRCLPGFPVLSQVLPEMWHAKTWNPRISSSISVR